MNRLALLPLLRPCFCALLLVGVQWVVAAAQAQPNTTVSAPRSGEAASPGVSVAMRLEALERTGQAAELDALRELQALRAQARPQGEEAVAIPFQMGHIYARRKDAGGLRAARTELAALGAKAVPQQALLAQLAQALLAVAEATAATDYAAVVLAVKTMEGVNLDSLPVLWRLRWTTAQANAKEEDGRLDEALLLRLRAVELAQQTQRDWRKGNVLLQLAFTHLRRDDMARAQEIVQQGLELVQQEPTDGDLANAHNTASIVYGSMGQTERARDLLLKGLIYTQRGEDRLRGLLTGNLADIYLRMRDYPRALRTAEEALALARAGGDRAAETLAVHNSGVAKIALKRVAEGKADVLRAIEMDRASGSVTYVSDGYRELGEYLERAGDLVGAVQAFHAYREIADTLERDDRRKAVSEAQAQYDNTVKEAQAGALQQETQLQAGQIEARKLQLVLWALLLASGVLAVVLLAALTRRTRAANQALALSNADLADQSERDPLTGAGNRNLWQRLLQAQPTGALTGQLLLVDVDHFKQINDRYGHAGGDQVLIELARRLRAATRENDAVIRWGGEEFLIFTQRSDDPAAVESLAERVLHDAGAEPVLLESGAKVNISVSLGFARFPLDNDSPLLWGWEEALALVDQLMYRAKSMGRNQAWGLLSSQAKDTAAVQAQLHDAESAQASGAVRLCRWRGPVTAVEEAP